MAVVTILFDKLPIDPNTAWAENISYVPFADGKEFGGRLFCLPVPTDIVPMESYPAGLSVGWVFSMECQNNTTDILTVIFRNFTAEEAMAMGLLLNPLLQLTGARDMRTYVLNNGAGITVELVGGSVKPITDYLEIHRRDAMRRGAFAPSTGH